MFKLDAEKLLSGLTSFEDRAEMAFRMYAEQSALKLQNWARLNRRWTDRTAHARQRMTAVSYPKPISSGYRIRLQHGVDYGIWLELANERKYAIIMEAIETVGSSEILPGLTKLLNRLGGVSK